MTKSRDINPSRYSMETVEVEVIERLRRIPLAPSRDLPVPPALRGVVPERAPKAEGDAPETVEHSTPSAEETRSRTEQAAISHSELTTEDAGASAPTEPARRLARRAEFLSKPRRIVVAAGVLASVAGLLFATLQPDPRTDTAPTPGEAHRHEAAPPANAAHAPSRPAARLSRDSGQPAVPQPPRAGASVTAASEAPEPLRAPLPKKPEAHRSHVEDRARSERPAPSASSAPLEPSPSAATRGAQPDLEASPLPD